MKKFDSAIKIQEEFDGEVEHVSGSLFLVKRDSIEFAKKGISSEDGKLVYGNPRWYPNSDGNAEAKGINRPKLEELKNSIKDRGVDHPIRLRVAERDGQPILEVVNGERRLRAIDELYNADEDCWDSTLQRKRSAVDLYERVECRIEYMDDATAVFCALQLNETSEIIGDSANIHAVKVLSESGYDESAILKMTGKSVTWLREMERLASLDPECLEHYQSDKINKTVALRLALIEDVEERVEKLNQIMQAATERHMEKVRKSRHDAEKAIEKADAEEFNDSVDQIESDHDQETPSKKASKAKARAEKAKKKLEEVSSEKITAKGRDEQKVTGSAKPLSHSKISSKLLKPLSDLINNDGSHEDGEFHMGSLIMIQAVLQAIISGDSDLMSILKEYCLEDSLQDASVSENEDEDSNEDEDEDSFVEDSNDSFVEDSYDSDEGEDSYDEYDDEDELAFRKELDSM